MECNPSDTPVNMTESKICGKPVTPQIRGQQIPQQLHQQIILLVIIHHRQYFHR